MRRAWILLLPVLALTAFAVMGVLYFRAEAQYRREQQEAMARQAARLAVSTRTPAAPTESAPEPVAEQPAPTEVASPETKPAQEDAAKSADDSADAKDDDDSADPSPAASDDSSELEANHDAQMAGAAAPPADDDTAPSDSSGGPVHVTGWVHTEAGEQISDYDVQPIAADGALRSVVHVHGAQGDLSVNVASDVRQLEIRAPGYLAYRADVPHDGDTIDALLSPSRTLRGTVVDAAGKPVGGATVLCDVCAAEGTTTDASGAFSLDTQRRAKRIHVVARAQSLSAEAVTGGELRLELGPPVQLTGHVPASAGQVRIVGIGSEQTVPIGKDGSFAASLDRGPYHFARVGAGDDTALIPEDADDGEVDLDGASTHAKIRFVPAAADPQDPTDGQ